MIKITSYFYMHFKFIGADFQVIRYTRKYINFLTIMHLCDDFESCTLILYCRYKKIIRVNDR